jgi:GNAT superfamily N-acetyltransferase
MIANQDHEIIAFVIAMPNIAVGLQQAKGHLWPWGIWHLYLSMRNSQKLDLLLGGVDPKYQGQGITSLLATSLVAEARKAKIKFMDSHLILEENRLMCAEMERLGAKLVKRYRIFQKTITT